MKERKSFWDGADFMGIQDWHVNSGGRGAESRQNIIVKQRRMLDGVSDNTIKQKRISGVWQDEGEHHEDL